MSATGNFLRSVGRNRQAVDYARKAVAQAPLAAGYRVDLGAALRADGRLQEAQSVFDEAVRLWPRNVLIWTLRTNAYLLGGQPETAAAILADGHACPGVPIVPIALMQGMASHLSAGAEGRQADALIARLLAAAEQIPLGMLCNYVCALGGVDHALRLLERAYWSAPTGATAPSGKSRPTDLLFDQPTRPLREDPRFGTLVARLGLEDYWQRTGKLPDYRLSR